MLEICVLVYNVTDAGIVSLLWVSRLRADHQAFIEPRDQNNGVNSKLGKGTGRAGVRHRTVYGHLASGVHACMGPDWRMISKWGFELLPSDARAVTSCMMLNLTFNANRIDKLHGKVNVTTHVLHLRAYRCLQPSRPIHLNVHIAHVCDQEFDPAGRGMFWSILVSTCSLTCHQPCRLGGRVSRAVVVMLRKHQKDHWVLPQLAFTRNPQWHHRLNTGLTKAIGNRKELTWRLSLSLSPRLSPSAPHAQHTKRFHAWQGWSRCEWPISTIKKKHE